MDNRKVGFLVTGRQKKTVVKVGHGLATEIVGIAIDRLRMFASAMGKTGIFQSVEHVSAFVEKANIRDHGQAEKTGRTRFFDQRGEFDFPGKMHIISREIPGQFPDVSRGFIG